MVAVHVPDRLAGAVEAFVAEVQSAVTAGTSSLDGVPFLDMERRINERASALVNAGMEAALESLDPRTSRIRVDGKVWTRMATYPVKVLGLHGDLVVSRALYRQADVRNGPTIDPVSLRAGLLECVTPAAFAAIGRLQATMPSREAEDLCTELGVLPTSRSSLERIGSRVGQRVEAQAIEAEEAFFDDFEVPAEAKTLLVSVDRAAIPEEEPREPTAADIAAGTQRPVTVAWRMGFCAMWALYNDGGEIVFMRRYAHMAKGGAQAIELSLAGDTHEILSARPDLRVVTVGDGAPEMQTLLQAAAQGPDVTRLLDYWHLAEKLGAALAALGKGAVAMLDAYQAWLFEDDAAIQRVEADLRRRAARRRDPPEAVLQALTYIENNRDLMRYATARAQGLPIGSGGVEATCKTIVGMRMRRPGARWLYDGGQAVLRLRAATTSSPTVWAHEIQQLVASLQKEVTPAT